jgi:antitoxin HigA-1
MSANRLAQGPGLATSEITDILNRRRFITADTAVRLGRYFGNRAAFWFSTTSRGRRDGGDEVA